MDNEQLSHIRDASYRLPPFVGNLTRALVDEIERLQSDLEPFIAIADVLPADWPGHCKLRIDTAVGGHEFIVHHSESTSHFGVLPSVDQWRSLQRVATDRC